MLAAKVVGLEHVRDVVIRGVAHDDGSKHGEFGIFINQRVHEAERYRRRVSSALGIEDFTSGPDTRTPPRSAARFSQLTRNADIPLAVLRRSGFASIHADALRHSAITSTFGYIPRQPSIRP